MPLSLQRRKELALMMLPSDDDMQQRVRNFLMRSGLNAGELAEQIGFAECSVRQFLNNKYGAHRPSEGNADNLKAACKAYMDRHDLQLSPELMGALYKSADFTEARACGLKALENRKAYVVDGPPGTQKTRCFLEIQREIHERALGEAIYVYCRVEHTKQSFLQEVCIAAGIPSRGQIDALLRKLQFFLGAKRRVLLIIDEGQHLSLSVLEIVRQLIDRPPFFGVMLGGSHDLTDRLKHWQMEQWRQRVQKTLSFRGPTKAEARKILAAQLDITDAAEADQIIADCKAEATRYDDVHRRRRKYDYISARLLFDFIQGAQAATPLALKETA